VKYQLLIGAPEEIRTPDPQIRSLDQPVDPAGFSCKPSAKSDPWDQWVSFQLANRVGLGAGRDAPAKVNHELAAQQTLSAARTAVWRGVNLCSDTDQFHEMQRQLWKLWGESKITDGDANHISFAIERRRDSCRTSDSHTKPLDASVGRLFSRFTPRQRQRSPDREASRHRRRRLGGSSALPDSLRHHYTEGQRAVLCVVAGEVKRHGICDWPIDKIGAVAGVCRTTVQTALHEARRLGHLKITERPQRGRKNLPNIIEIVSPKWREWMRRAPSAARMIGSNSPKMMSPTKNIDSRKRPSKEEKAGKWTPGANATPPDMRATW
jgi:hypothetical protein